MYKNFGGIPECAECGGTVRGRRAEERPDTICTDNGANKSVSTWGLEGYPLASVYAPLQSFDELYDKETALAKGTVFAQLDLPFMGESVYKGGNCRG